MTESEQHNSNDRFDSFRGACPAPEELSAWFDGALDTSGALRVEVHANSCPMCQLQLQDFRLLRVALKATTPAFTSRSFTLSGPSPVGRSGTIKRTDDRIRPFPLFPAFAAIAAILLIALIAGEIITRDGGSDRTRSDVADQVVFINGTPFTQGDNDAEFGAASAAEMNQADSESSSAVENDSERSLFTGWRIAQLLALVGLISASWFWFDRRRAARPSLQ
jgi:hypothetical protein